MTVTRLSRLEDRTMTARAAASLVFAVLAAAASAGSAGAQGVLLPPGEVLRPRADIPGAAQPTLSQMFSPQVIFLPPSSASPPASRPAAPAQPAASQPATIQPVALQAAPAASVPAETRAAPPVIAAPPIPMPAPRPASANAAPAQTLPPPTQLAASPALPATVAAPQRDQNRAAGDTLQRVSDYWNRVQMLSGTFVQVDPDGSRKTGDFYMQKPGRVRFEYDAPVPLELISNGQSVAVRDRNLNTQDITPLSQTPLRFLLAERTDLARDPHVVGAYQDNLYVTVVMEEKVPMLGTYKLMLLFDAKDYTLRQWIVTDPQGYDTSVAISNLNYSARPDPKLFVINFERMLQ
ncbi:LolA family protein [Aquabacter spiritensis]|uniref:Outer membrane lipoprotein-sorting protein n=1 Tax=Aquabacter spiritensis TaxID=933073 RepID=A0A4R3M0Q6_9HYPH|nr:outer-membrane lipoprotein carrier protein LolA [Aquabacter spiritensis]TCT06661.1 outer membrane lipoprotein-sorting protein [Aquabacter spiritensis]